MNEETPFQPKGWCNMLLNGISRYFETNFEVSLLFLRVKFLSVLFFTLFKTMGSITHPLGEP